MCAIYTALILSGNYRLSLSAVAPPRLWAVGFVLIRQASRQEVAAYGSQIK